MLLTRSSLRDLRRSLNNFTFEEDGNRIWVPGTGLSFGGAMAHDLNGADLRIDDNLVVKEGRIYDIVTALANGSAIGSWYIAPYKQNATVLDTWTGANFAGNAGEFTNYTESTRQQLVFPDPTTITDASISNAASLAYITIDTGGDTTIWGGGVLSNPARSATTGKLWAAVKFATARSGLQATDRLGFNYLLTASSS